MFYIYVAITADNFHAFHFLNLGSVLTCFASMHIAYFLISLQRPSQKFGLYATVKCDYWIMIRNSYEVYFIQIFLFSWCYSLLENLWFKCYVILLSAVLEGSPLFFGLYRFYTSSCFSLDILFGGCSLKKEEDVTASRSAMVNNVNGSHSRSGRKILKGGSSVNQVSVFLRRG